jgi:hypothetical protein
MRSLNRSAGPGPSEARDARPESERASGTSAGTRPFDALDTRPESDRSSGASAGSDGSEPGDRPLGCTSLEIEAHCPEKDETRGSGGCGESSSLLVWSPLMSLLHPRRCNDFLRDNILSGIRNWLLGDDVATGERIV